MIRFPDLLPIDDALPDLTAALSTHHAAVLVAPPGAGKTTRTPLVLAGEAWAASKKVVVLEPRRLAARAAAERMARTLGEALGETVGLRARFGSKVSRRTRIEVVTEGVFTRMILNDPTLEGVAAILFDEFHERSLDADLGLALARDAQSGLRDDLKLLVMSATIDGARIAAALGDAPVIESRGRSFPVETRYLGRDARLPIEEQVAGAVMRALRAEHGSILAFLPGAAEIHRTERRLRERIADASVDIAILHGALDRSAQDRAIAPSAPGRRKVVLATSIAETSITIEGVRVVVDSGLARVPRYEPDVGLTRLETVRVSRASADQRRGRSGRTEPGVCYRLWDEPQTASLEPYVKPEILAADLSSFVLDLAQWGVTDPGALTFLDPPPAPALTEARRLLSELGALDSEGRITEQGRALRRLPLPPRLSRMVLDATATGQGPLAADIAVILTERGLGGDDVDLRHRIDMLERDRSQRAEQARRMAARWAEMAKRANPPDDIAAPPAEKLSAGGLLALAFPDRVAKSRGGDSGAFVLASGRGSIVDPISPLAREPFLAIGELAGSAAQGRIVVAAPITQTEIETIFLQHITEARETAFDPGSESVRTRRVKRLGALVISDRPEPAIAGEETARILGQGMLSLGLSRLPWTKAVSQWRDRVMFLRALEGEPWPDLSDNALAQSCGEWLVPALAGMTALKEFSAEAFAAALATLLPWELRRRLDVEAPTHVQVPTGSRVAIDYSAEGGPKISVRVQELFGLDRHPAIARGRVPLVVELLSPAHRPIQVTQDLPGFWRGSYGAVKSEMRGRYPKHPWPDDPLSAPPTRKAKPRKT